MNFEEQEKIERIKSRNEYAVLAIKNVTLLNGAAAISILTLLGAIVKELGKQGVVISIYQFVPIVFFGVGALCGPVAAGIANWSQQKHIEDKETAGKIRKKFAISVVIIGYLCFIVGLSSAFYFYAISKNISLSTVPEISNCSS